MNIQNKIKAVIFDMDGVLLDAREWHYEAFNKALNKFGFNVSRDEHINKYDGLPTKKKLSMMNDVPSKLHGEISKLKQSYTFELMNKCCVPEPQHLLCLSTLKAKGYRLGLASNSIRDTVDLMLDKTGLREFFDVTLSNQDIEKPKPAPDIYVRACEMLDISSSECLVVEDNEYGVRSALDAGTKVLRVNNPTCVNYEKVRVKLAEIEQDSNQGSGDYE